VTADLVQCGIPRDGIEEGPNRPVPPPAFPVGPEADERLLDGLLRVTCSPEEPFGIEAEGRQVLLQKLPEYRGIPRLESVQERFVARQGVVSSPVAGFVLHGPVLEEEALSEMYERAAPRISGGEDVVGVFRDL